MSITLLIALARSGPASSDSRLEELGEVDVAGQHRRVVARQAVVGAEAGVLGVGKLGQAAADLLDELVGELEGHHVGLGEVAVVVRLFLAAQAARALGADVVVARLLDDRGRRTR